MGEKTPVLQDEFALSVEKRLSGLVNRQDSIEALSLWIIHHKSNCSAIVKIWFKVLRKSQTKKRLTLFYLVNDVLQNCKRKNAKIYLLTFSKVLKDAVVYVRDKGILPKIERIFSIWEQRSVYKNDFVKELKEILADARKIGSQIDPHFFEEFKTSTTVDAIKELKEAEDSATQTSLHLAQVRLDASSSDFINTVRDRTHSSDMGRKFEESCVKIEEYVEALEKEIACRTKLIEIIEKSQLFYEAQHADAKLVVNAYTNFGHKLRLQKTLVSNRQLALFDPAVSPVPSPEEEPSSEEEGEGGEEGGAGGAVDMDIDSDEDGGAQESVTVAEPRPITSRITVYGGVSSNQSAPSRPAAHIVGADPRQSKRPEPSGSKGTPTEPAAKKEDKSDLLAAAKTVVSRMFPSSGGQKSDQLASSAISTSPAGGEPQQSSEGGDSSQLPGNSPSAYVKDLFSLSKPSSGGVGLGNLKELQAVMKKVTEQSVPSGGPSMASSFNSKSESWLADNPSVDSIVIPPSLAQSLAALSKLPAKPAAPTREPVATSVASSAPFSGLSDGPKAHEQGASSYPPGVLPNQSGPSQPPLPPDNVPLPVPPPQPYNPAMPPPAPSPSDRYSRLDAAALPSSQTLPLGMPSPHSPAETYSRPSPAGAKDIYSPFHDNDTPAGAAYYSPGMQSSKATVSSSSVSAAQLTPDENERKSFENTGAETLQSPITPLVSPTPHTQPPLVSSQPASIYQKRPGHPAAPLGPPGSQPPAPNAIGSAPWRPGQITLHNTTQHNRSGDGESHGAHSFDGPQHIRPVPGAQASAAMPGQFPARGHFDQNIMNLAEGDATPTADEPPVGSVPSGRADAQMRQSHQSNLIPLGPADSYSASASSIVTPRRPGPLSSQLQPKSSKPSQTTDTNQNTSTSAPNLPVSPVTAPPAVQCRGSEPSEEDEGEALMQITQKQLHVSSENSGVRAAKKDRSEDDSSIIFTTQNLLEQELSNMETEATDPPVGQPIQTLGGSEIQTIGSFGRRRTEDSDFQFTPNRRPQNRRPSQGPISPPIEGQGRGGGRGFHHARGGPPGPHRLSPPFHRGGARPQVFEYGRQTSHPPPPPPPPRAPTPRMFNAASPYRNQHAPRGGRPHW